jgi:VWFA-related protein
VLDGLKFVAFVTFVIFVFRMVDPAVLSAQESPRFRSGIDLVSVDVVVLDRKGVPVTDLTRADFTVTEDGQRQDITDFEAVSVAPPAAVAVRAPAPLPLVPVSTNVSRSFARPAGRAFAVVFDDMNLTRSQADQARKAVKDLLETAVSPDDTVTLSTTSGVAWLNARMPQDRERLLAVMSRVEGKFVPDSSAERMTDYEAMRIHQYSDTTVEARVKRRYENYRVAGLEPVRPQDQDDMPKVGETRGDVGVIASYIQSRAESVYAAAEARNRATLNLVARTVDSLRGARGRKAVILLSKGFIYDTEIRGFKDVSRAAREANVVIYFIDARGLEAATSEFTAEAIGPVDAHDIGAAYAGIALEAAGAVSVAEDSGGFAVQNTNDLSAGIRRIADESRHYYLVGYISRNGKRDGRFRRIEVKVRRPGVTVRARRGYYAPDEKEARVVRVGLDPEVQRALDAPRDVPDVPVRATALVFQEAKAGVANVLVATETDVRQFAFEPRQDRVTDVLELALAVTNTGTGEVSRFGQNVEMNLLADTRATLDRTWYPLSHALELSPGGYQARVVVRDRNSGRVGSVTHEFIVPALAGFRLSSPILSDAVEAQRAARTAKPIVVARRTFAAGSTLFCQFSVYGAAKDPASRMPRVTGGWTLRRADGVIVRSAPAQPLAPAADGALIRLYGISLANLAAGDYELLIDVRDELGVRAVQAREPFTVEPALGIAPVVKR